MKKKEYVTFVKVLESSVNTLIEKFNREKEEDAQRYARNYLCGWDDGAISICEVIKEQIEKLKKGEYNY